MKYLIIILTLTLNSIYIQYENNCNFGKLKKTINFNLWNDMFIDYLDSQKRFVYDNSMSAMYLRNRDLEDAKVLIRENNGNYFKRLLKESIASEILDTMDFDSLYYIQYHLSGEARINGFYIIQFAKLSCNIFEFTMSNNLRFITHRINIKEEREYAIAIEDFRNVFDSLPNRHHVDEHILISKIYNDNCKVSFINRVVIRPNSRHFSKFRDYLIDN